MKRRNKWLLGGALVVMVLAAYPAFVLTSVYSRWLANDLPGGRNGPSDAYRHTLASATVAYTSTPLFVTWATAFMEDAARNDMSAMDVHNNRIGARIGANAPSWSAMQAQVLEAVHAGDVYSQDPDRVTWLPRDRWIEWFF